MKLALVALILLACGSPPAPNPPAPPPSVERGGSASNSPPTGDTAPTRDFAPMLFTIEQLRAGNAKGRIIELRMELDGKPPTIEHWEFTAVDEKSGTIHAVTKDEAGNVLADQTNTSTWDELYKHGQFPASTTKFEDNVSITVPAGTFTTRLYTVNRDGATWRFWFASNLPGPPVQFTREKDGKITVRATMLRAR